MWGIHESKERKVDVTLYETGQENDVIIIIFFFKKQLSSNS